MEVVREERKIETEGKRQNSREMGLFCPLCYMFAGRRIRNKLYVGTVALSSRDTTVVSLPGEDMPR